MHTGRCFLTHAHSNSTHMVDPSQDSIYQPWTEHRLLPRLHPLEPNNSPSACTCSGIDARQALHIPLRASHPLKNPPHRYWNSRLPAATLTVDAHIRKQATRHSARAHPPFVGNFHTYCSCINMHMHISMHMHMYTPTTAVHTNKFHPNLGALKHTAALRAPHACAIAQQREHHLPPPVAHIVTLAHERQHDMNMNTCMYHT
jgi:hypothetical protein